MIRRDRNERSDRGDRGDRGDNRRGGAMGVVRGKKICRFCENKINYINYKDERLLRRFTNERGKILPRRITGNCSMHQRKLTCAVKRGRILAIVAFESESYR